jgi:hypothetical protein
MGNVMDVLLRVLGGLVPPDSADPRKQYRYQIRVGLTLSFLVLAFVGFVISDHGWMPTWSEGFARTADLRSLTVEIQKNRVQSIDNQLLELRIKHCNATTDDAKQLYWAKIAPLIYEYQQLTNRVYNLPACGDL